MILIREIAATDRTAWIEMRRALWPEEADHVAAVDAVAADPDYWAFIAETPEGTPVGFAEVAIRKYANGCDSQPVPFLEGIWVAEPLRRQGIGRELIAAIERLFRARGFTELGSDTQLDNSSSQAAHGAWGFSETERVVYFRKLLSAPSR